MTVGLEKLVQDIKSETSIWPIEKSKNTPEENAAWERVGAKNKMSGNHVKSIFKVLSKKYEAEKIKPKTNWKLFESLKFLDETNEPEEEDDDDIPDDANLEDDGEFVELLEVNEFEDSDYEDNESGTGSTQSSRNVSMEDEQQPKPKTEPAKKSSLQNPTVHKQYPKKQETPPTQSVPRKYQTQNAKPSGVEIRKIVLPQQKSLLATNNKQYNKSSKSPTPTASSTVVTNTNGTSADERNVQKLESTRNQMQLVQQQIKRTTNIESLKRKLSADTNDNTKTKSAENLQKDSPPNKKQSIDFVHPQGSKIERQQKSTDSHKETKIKIENSNLYQNGIDMQNSVIMTEIKKDIDNGESFDYATSNVDTILPSFFRDLYNSKKYDCFGMYVASAMNRLPSHLASKLEGKILQSIIEVNSTNI